MTLESPSPAPACAAPGCLPTVSVVVVTWNGADRLDECLTSLRRQTVADRIETIVVDNGSVDDTPSILERHAGHVVAILNRANLGFATGCNQGIRASRAPYVALLNDDAVVEPEWVEALLRVIERDPTVGAVTSKILSYDDRTILDNVGHVVFADGLTRGRGRLERDRGQYEQIEEVFCASGCAALLRRTMLVDVGLFDDAFFAYCDDADLGFRARLRGWRTLYVPDAVVYHRFSASTSTFSELKALNVERNRLWLAVKNLPLPLLMVSPAFTFLRYVWQAYGALQGRGASGQFVAQSSRGALIGLLLRAYGQALAGLPRALKQRRSIQSRRTASTVEVMRWLTRYGISARAIALME
ncbi:MAG: glycosyltransferase family 2 protein [Chloroflexi bacterium]|nr:glycosyltransferase family 2 protein [Chloroflexota bacterium]